MSFIIRSKRKEKRFYIDNEFLNGYAKKVKWQGQAIYLALCRHERDGKAFPSVKHLAEELGISDWSAKKGIRKLKEYHIVTTERRGKMLPNIYWLLDIKEWKKVPKSEWSNTPITKVKGVGHLSERSRTPTNNTNLTILNNRVRKRTKSKFPKSWYSQALKCYTQAKRIKPQGEEWKPLQQDCKTMFMSGRTPEQICGCIEWLKNQEFLADKFTLKTVRLKMPEYMVSKLKDIGLRSQFPSFEEILKEKNVSRNKKS